VEGKSAFGKLVLVVLLAVAAMAAVGSGAVSGATFAALGASNSMAVIAPPPTVVARGLFGPRNVAFAAATTAGALLVPPVGKLLGPAIGPAIAAVLSPAGAGTTAKVAVVAARKGVVRPLVSGALKSGTAAVAIRESLKRGSFETLKRVVGGNAAAAAAPAAAAAATATSKAATVKVPELVFSYAGRDGATKIVRFSPLKGLFRALAR